MTPEARRDVIIQIRDLRKDWQGPHPWTALARAAAAEFAADLAKLSRARGLTILALSNDHQLNRKFAGRLLTLEAVTGDPEEDPARLALVQSTSPFQLTGTAAWAMLVLTSIDTTAGAPAASDQGSRRR